MNERLEAIVRGRVQLVMYRDFARRKALRLKLCGEVRNLPDGTVRVVAEGPREALEKYLEKLHRGSVLARVEGIDARFREATGQYDNFSIIYA
jgi:acylphosphatase